MLFRRIFLLLSAIILLLLPTLSVNAASKEQTKGTCGNLQWEYFPDSGLLHISGTGKIPTYYNTPTPWNAFLDSIRRISIVEGVTAIGGYAFQNCVAATSVSIPDTVTKIGLHAFSGCTSLKNIQLPLNLTEIGGSAFYNCSALQQISIPPGVTQLSDYTFAGCTSLLNVSLHDNILNIERNAFRDCASLRSITLPKHLREISNRAFSGCRSLSYIALPDGITYLGNSAFQDCTALSCVMMPSSLKTIGLRAFYGCESLWHIIYLGSTEEWTSLEIYPQNDVLQQVSLCDKPSHTNPPSYFWRATSSRHLQTCPCGAQSPELQHIWKNENDNTICTVCTAVPQDNITPGYVILIAAINLIPLFILLIIILKAKRHKRI